MIFQETKLPGAHVILPQRLEDERGFFALTWRAGDFEQRGLTSKLVQCNISFNTRKGTLRGMHYQAAPAEQCKLVRCTMGAIYDVIIDLREDSPTYREWIGVELTAENRQMLFIPEGFAHGFQALRDGSEVFYQIGGAAYAPDRERGVRWNDPAFAIQWPSEVTVISPRDAAYPDFEPSIRKG